MKSWSDFLALLRESQSLFDCPVKLKKSAATKTGKKFKSFEFKL